MAEPNTVEGINPDSPAGVANYWLTQIQYAERKVKQFRTTGKQIIRRYKNVKSAASSNVMTVTAGQKRLNVLWSNIQTLKPVLFSNTPKPNVTRRNKDKNPVGRWAATVLERTLVNTLDMQPFDHVMEQDIENLLLPGYGCSMIEYVAETEQDQMGWQEARFRYVDWCDQLHNPARYWQEVWWWAYVSYLTRDELRKRYGNKIAMEVVLDHKEGKDADDSMSKSTVWCIWDSRSRKIIHLATGYPQGPLGEYDPPVNFEGFFPIARPLMATTASDSTIPVPDFTQYKDQADEIDMYTQRIDVLGRSLRVRALYPGDMESIRQLMDNANDADMIPVPNWAMVSERGGAANLVAYFPIEQVAKVLEQCHENRERAIEAMYQETGISDIIRGASDPNETLGGQQLKAQFASVRIRDRQRDVQRYIRDILRHMASVIGQHFTLEVLQKMSGVTLLTQAQKQQVQMAVQAWQQFGQAQQQWGHMMEQGLPQGIPPLPQPQPPGFPQPPEEAMEALKEPAWEEVIALLRDEKLRGFVIDIETDSTIEADQLAQQQKAEQFLTAVTQYCTAWAQILPVAPFMAPLAGEMLMQAARLFKMGDNLETVIEEMTEQMEKMAEAPKPPDPQMQAEQAKMQATQVKAQTDIAGAQIGQQTAQIKAGAEQQKAKLSIVQTLAEHHTTMKEKEADLAIAAATPPPQAAE